MYCYIFKDTPANTIVGMVFNATFNNISVISRRFSFIGGSVSRYKNY
jgi:hypothetical protein